MTSTKDSIFRIRRNRKWQDVEFTDMTKHEMQDVIEGKGMMWLRNMIVFLGQKIQELKNNRTVYVVYSKGDKLDESSTIICIEAVFDDIDLANEFIDEFSTDKLKYEVAEFEINCPDCKYLGGW